MLRSPLGNNSDYNRHRQRAVQLFRPDDIQFPQFLPQPQPGFEARIVKPISGWISASHPATIPVSPAPHQFACVRCNEYAPHKLAWIARAFIFIIPVGSSARGLIEWRIRLKTPARIQPLAVA